MANKKLIAPILFTDNYVEKPFVFEEWKLVNLDGVIKNYYWISNCGRLKNKDGFILKPYMINNGYYTYRLYTGKLTGARYKTFLVHRIVKMFFDPIPYPELYTVNHEDMNPENNYDDNLTWMSQAENNEHKFKNLHVYGINHYKAKFNTDQLKIILNELEKGTCYKDILNILGIEDTDNNRDSIGNIKRGITYQREIKNILK